MTEIEREIERERRMATLETKVGNIENIQTQIQGDVKDMKSSINSLPDTLIAKLDDRYALKKTVETMQETIDPLTSLRKRVWSIMLAGAFSLAALAFLAVEYIKSNWR